MNEREVLIMVFQFLRHPPSGGGCCYVNVDALNNLMDAVCKVLNKESSQNDNTD